jgi:signal transduction histidine kinase
MVATTTPAEARYEEMNKGLSGVNGAGAAAITLVTMLAAFGDWRTVAAVAAIQFPVIGVNLALNQWGVPRFGMRAEILRTVVNLSSGLVVATVTDWSFPNWLWQPFVALAFDQFGRRAAAAIVIVFALTQDTVALTAGQPIVYPIGASVLTLFCWENVRVRHVLIREMVTRADRDRAALSDAHESLKEEVAARSRAEVELRHAHKLEAVGRLAAGIAHEINTPLQFVGDSLAFIRDGAQGLLALAEALRGETRSGAEQGRALDAARLTDAVTAADLDWLAPNLPTSIETARDGVARVAAIVRAMRQFASVDPTHKAPADLNDAIRTSLAMARSAYKLVADVDTDLADGLPLVRCHAGEIHQVLLEIILNAAHAVEDRTRVTGGRGRISVRSTHDLERVRISVADTGLGIPAELCDRVFEPFFTTKAPGRGTGQGLAVARAVVDRHGGRIWFETDPAVGTTFHLELPCAGADPTRPPRDARA